MSRIESTPAERNTMLEQCLWSRDFDASVRQALSEVMGAHTLAKGAQLVEEDDEKDWMGLIISGECEVSQSVMGSDARVLRVMGPGRAFGELALVDGAPRSASLEAITDMTYLRITRSALEAMLDTSPRAAYAVMQRIATGLVRRVRASDRNRF